MRLCEITRGSDRKAKVGLAAFTARVVIARMCIIGQFRAYKNAPRAAPWPKDRQTWQCICILSVRQLHVGFCALLVGYYCCDCHFAAVTARLPSNVTFEMWQTWRRLQNNLAFQMASPAKRRHPQNNFNLRMTSRSEWRHPQNEATL